MPYFHRLPRVDDSSEGMNRDTYHGSSLFSDLLVLQLFKPRSGKKGNRPIEAASLYTTSSKIK
jgi:hypothetical protein